MPIPSLPTIEPDADSRAFWAAIRDGHLVIQRCCECGATRGYPQAYCHACLSSRLEQVRCSGEGTVYSFTTIHRAASPEFASLVPYSLALVDLAEGARLLVRVVAHERSLAVGAAVRACFAAAPAGLFLPVFEVVG